MSLIFIPLYIKFMGIEAYGLVGIFTAMLALFSLLDMGLIQTLNREMARLSVLENSAQEMRDLLRTLEIPYWTMAVLIGGTVMALAHLIAYQWVNPKSLSPATVQRAIIIMGLVMGFQWPLGFYSGGLMGLQRQVLLNGINAVMAAVRGAGAVLVLWLISPSVEAFFSWQIFVSAVHTGLVAFFLWYNLPATSVRPRFRRDMVDTIWRFAAGITGISLLSAILMQLDKVILSKMLNLEMFGYYALANVVSMNIYRLFAPVFSATYPRITNLVAMNANEELTKLYHKSAQLVSVLTIPAVIVIALFSKEILLLWTQNPTTAENTYLLVSILVIGTALNGLMHIPYGLQLAYGWTKLAFFLNLASVIVLAPLMIVLTKSFGVLGAASVWVILNAGYVIIGIQIMHRRLLPNEKWRWYKEDVGIPLVVSLVVAGTFRLLNPDLSGFIYNMIYLIVVSAITLSITALATSATRSWLYSIALNLRVCHATKS